MSIAWVTETTFQLPALMKFQGYKPHAQNSAAWVDAFYESPAGQQKLVDQQLALTDALKREDTVRDVEMLLIALRTPLNVLTLFGFNVTNVVFGMRPYAPHQMTVVDLAKYTIRDYETPEGDTTPVWEQALGFPWQSPTDLTLPQSSGVAVAFIMLKRTKLHMPSDMVTQFYAYDLFAAGKPSANVSILGDYQTGVPHVLLWDVQTPATFADALRILKPHIEALQNHLLNIPMKLAHASNVDVQAAGLFWILQPDLENGQPRPALDARPTAWASRYDLIPEERALLGYCRLMASLIKSRNLNVIDRLIDWINQSLDGFDLLLSTQLLVKDLAGQFPEYANASMTASEFFGKYYTLLSSLPECLRAIYAYRYGYAPEATLFDGIENLNWLEILMLLHNLGLLDVLGFTRVVNPPQPFEFTSFDLTGYYESPAETVFAETMMIRHTGKYLSGRLILRRAHSDGRTRHAIYEFTGTDVAEGVLDIRTPIESIFATDSDAEDMPLSFVTDLAAKLIPGDGQDDYVQVTLEVPFIAKPLVLNQFSRKPYRDEEDIVGQFSEREYAVHHAVSWAPLNYDEEKKVWETADQIVLFVHAAYIIESSQGARLARLAWEEALRKLALLAIFNPDTVTFSAGLQFPFVQELIRRFLQSTLVGEETISHNQTIWYILLGQFRENTVPDVQDILDALQVLLGIMPEELAALPSDEPYEYTLQMYGITVSRSVATLLKGGSKALTKGVGLGVYMIKITRNDPAPEDRVLWPAYYIGIGVEFSARFDVLSVNSKLITFPKDTGKFEELSTKTVYGSYKWLPDDFWVIIQLDVTSDLRLMMSDISLFKTSGMLLAGGQPEVLYVPIKMSLFSLDSAATTPTGPKVRTKLPAIEVIALMPVNRSAVGLLTTDNPSVLDFLQRLTGENSYQLAVTFAAGQTQLSESARQIIREFVAKYRVLFQMVTMVMDVHGYGSDTEPVYTGLERAQTVYDYLYTLLGPYLGVWTHHTLLDWDITADAALRHTVVVRLANSIHIV
jgi:hypothetical protein